MRSPIQDRKSMPAFGAPATVELLEEMAGGLEKLEKHSHFWVLAWLGEAERDVLTVTPRHARGAGDAGVHGVFAVRSPARPNPIGLTAARLLEVHGTRLRFDLLDFVDGTVVVDIKPYFATRDLIFSADNEQIGRPADIGALRESLLFQALAFHGRLSSDLALGVRVLEHFRGEVLGFNDPVNPVIHVPRGRPPLVDAIMAATRVTYGRGNLRLERRDAVKIAHDGYAFDYELLAASDNDPAAILGAPYEALFCFEAYGP